MAVLEINGIAMPTPSTLEITRSDLSSSETGRTQRGIMKKDIVRKIVTLSCTWPVLKWSDCARLISTVESSTNMSIKYPDPKEGKYIAKTFYVGDRKAPALMLEDGKEKWEGIAFDFIEV